MRTRLPAFVLRFQAVDVVLAVHRQPGDKVCFSVAALGAAEHSGELFGFVRTLPISHVGEKAHVASDGARRVSLPAKPLRPHDRPRKASGAGSCLPAITRAAVAPSAAAISIQPVNAPKMAFLKMRSQRRRVPLQI